MKRFSLREVLLLTAPIPIIALGFWGARFREEKWPTKPRIVECRVRPATPLEISQGANVGVTVHAVIPTKPNSCPILTYSLSSQKIQTGDKKSEIKSVELWSEEHSKYLSNHEIENTYAYNWKRSPNLPLHSARIELYSVCGGMKRIAKNFTLPISGLPLPEVVRARRANFRVTNATLEFYTNAGIFSSHQKVILDIEDATDESQGLMSKPLCVGDWILYDNGKKPLKASVPSWSGSGPKISQVWVRLNWGNVTLPPKPMAKIRGQLSINRGWPQEIIVEWPKKLSANSALTEMKFSTKLAPLPH